MRQDEIMAVGSAGAFVVLAVVMGIGEVTRRRDAWHRRTASQRGDAAQAERPAGRKAADKSTRRT